MEHLEVTMHAVNGAAARGECNVCVAVTVSGFVSLGLDKGEVLDRPRLIRAIAENLSRLIQDSDGEAIDASYLESIENT